MFFFLQKEWRVCIGSAPFVFKDFLAGKLKFAIRAYRKTYFKLEGLIGS